MWRELARGGGLLAQGLRRFDLIVERGELKIDLASGF